MSVEIIYKVNNPYPIIKVNGVEKDTNISCYRYIFDDIFRWADDFFRDVDSEIREPYRVSLVGHPYQKVILLLASKQSEYCQGIDFQTCEGRISLSEKYNIACRLYNAIGEKVRPLTFHTTNYERFSKYSRECLHLSAIDDSEYCIAESEEQASSFLCKYCIIVSDKNDFVIKGNKFFFYVKEDTLEHVLSYFADYHHRFIVVDNMCKHIERYSLESRDVCEFYACVKEEYRVWAEAIPTDIESGIELPWKIHIFPSSFSPENLQIVSSNADVLGYENGKLIPERQGNATIYVRDANGHELFSKTFTVHSYVKTITIPLQRTTLTVGSTLQFQTILSPANAEDKDQITVESSDERIAVMSNINEIYAVSPGSVCITVSTLRAKQSFYVTIPPAASDVVLSTEKSLSLPFSSEATIYGAVYPANAFPKPDLKWSIDDRNGRGARVISIINCDNRRCVIRSRESGNAVLVCRLEGTNIEKRINVSVASSKGCYIATSVYGSYDCPEVWILRRYRDEYLDGHAFGRLFIKCYYAISPTVVRVFGKNTVFNKMCHWFLEHKIDKLKKKGYESTPYKDKEY